MLNKNTFWKLRSLLSSSYFLFKRFTSNSFFSQYSLSFLRFSIFFYNSLKPIMRINEDYLHKINNTNKEYHSSFISRKCNNEMVFSIHLKIFYKTLISKILQCYTMYFRFWFSVLLPRIRFTMTSILRYDFKILFLSI